MSHVSTVLIIEEDSQKRQIYKSVLEFVEQEGRITDCRHWKETLTQSNTISAILLGDCGLDETLRKVFDGIREINADLPLIRLVDKNNKIQKNRSEAEAYVQSESFNTIDLPLKYSQLNDVLHQAVVYNARQTPRDSRSTELFRSLVGNSRSVRCGSRRVFREAASPFPRCRTSGSDRARVSRQAALRPSRVRFRRCRRPARNATAAAAAGSARTP